MWASTLARGYRKPSRPSTSGPSPERSHSTWLSPQILPRSCGLRAPQRGSASGLGTGWGWCVWPLEATQTLPSPGTRLVPSKKGCGVARNMGERWSSFSPPESRATWVSWKILEILSFSRELKRQTLWELNTILGKLRKFWENSENYRIKEFWISNGNSREKAINFITSKGDSGESLEFR